MTLFTNIKRAELGYDYLPLTPRNLTYSVKGAHYTYFIGIALTYT